MDISITGTNLTISGLWQYDYGQTLEFSGMEIPDSTECQYYQGSYASRVYTVNNTAAIPDILLSSSKEITAYLYVRNNTDGETIIKMTILINTRPKPTDYVDPTPPVDYSRLLPVSGEDGDTLVFGPEGPYWESDPGKSVQWENISGKPDAFPPTAHRHPASAIAFEDGDSLQDKYDSDGIPVVGDLAIAAQIEAAQTDIVTLQSEATARWITLDATEARSINNETRINELEAIIAELLAIHNTSVTAHQNMTVDGGAMSVQSGYITDEEAITIDGNV